MNLYPTNPHILKKIWAKKPVSEAQTLPQSNSLYSNQQQTKTKSFSLLANLSEDSTLRQDNPAFSHTSTKSQQQQSNPKFSFADANNSNRQARPTKVEVHQAPNSAVIIITDNPASCGEQSGGDSPGSGQGDGESDGSGGGDGSPSGERSCRPPQKKIKRENDHPSPKQSINFNPQPARINLSSSNRNTAQQRPEFEIESNCSTNDMQAEEKSDFSPLLGFAQGSQSEYPKEEEFKLDDESFFPDSTTCSDEDNSYLKEAGEIASHFEGICASRRCASETALLQFKCKLGHPFELNLSEVRGKWCPRCEKNLQKLREYAQSHKGKVMNAFFSDRITYQCEKEHTWTIGYKNAQKRWCAQCAKADRAAIKQQFKQENQKKQMMDAEVQKKLFEEARKNTQIPSNNTGPTHLPFQKPPQSANDAKKNIIEYFEKIEANVDQLARKHTAEYMASKDFNGQCTQEQVLQVYKVALMPEQIFKSYM